MRRARVLLGSFFPELFAFSLGLALTSDRLLGLPGPESALLIGALVSPALAAWVASRPRLAPRASISRALLRSLSTLAAALLPLLIHALFVPFCAPREAFLFWAFGPGFGLPLAALLGAAAREVTKRPVLAPGIALFFTLGSVVMGVVEFWRVPGIVVFGEFGGYFPGTFYDAGVTFPEAMFSYRLGSAFLAIGLATIIVTSGAVRRPGPLALVAFSILAFISFRASGERLGHLMTEGRIVEALGGSLEGELCTLHHPRELARETAALHLEDCDREVRRIAELAHAPRAPRVDVYLYRSAGEKRALMGAGRIDLAKPWRREAHLVLDRFPHPVLTHELVHVVGAELASGPFDVPGSFFGLVPNAGLIEGFAVALAWDERMHLDPHQAARALLELGKLPPANEITTLAFVRHPSSVAYAAAGSFLRFIMEEKGGEALSRVYAAGSLEPLSEDIGSLEARYHERLREVALPDGAVELAATRFARPSVFHAACPHETTALRTKLGGDLASGDFGAAADRAEEILAIDDADLAAHVERVRALALSERPREARRAHDLIAERGFPAPLLARSLTALGDERLLSGQLEGAREHYAEALSLPQTDDAARGIELRLYALERGGPLLELVRELFLGSSGRPPDSVSIMHLAESISAMGEPSLGAYLSARQLAVREAHAATLERLERVDHLPSARFEQEAARMRLRALFALGRLTEAEELAGQLTRDPATAHDAHGLLERMRGGGSSER